MPERPDIRSLEAERAVVGACLMDKAALPVVKDILSLTDFDATAHQTIMSAIISLADRGQPPDTVLLGDELRKSGVLAKVGGLAYLCELIDTTPSAANVGHYARVVRDKSIARGLVEAAGRIIEKVHNPNGDGTEALQTYAQKEILGATSAGSGSGAVEIRELIMETFHGIEERRKRGDALPGLSTGLRQFDALTGGLKAGGLYVIAGRPGTGKTALGLNIAWTITDGGGRTVLFSLEMPGAELALRMLSSSAGLDGHRLSRGYLANSELPAAVRATDALARLPLTIDDTGGLPIDRLMARARRIKMEKGLALIVVDYLQLVRPSQRWNVREQEVAEVSRSLKTLAKELCVPVLATAQLNRGIESRTDKRPTLADLRESGAIEQDADVIGFLSGNGDGTDLLIQKHRQGPTGTIRLIFDRPTQTFRDANGDDRPPVRERADLA